MALTSRNEMKAEDLVELAAAARRRHEEAIRRLDETSMAALAAAWIECLQAGGKILFCGNGGSAADAQHFATELTVRYRNNGPALAGLALTTDTSALTAAGNDFGFEMIFARQVEAFGRPGDLLVGITTSGTSANVLAALRQARGQGLTTLGLCGRDPGPLADCCDFVFAVPTTETARIQEAHALAMHIACEAVEGVLRV